MDQQALPSQWPNWPWLMTNLSPVLMDAMMPELNGFACSRQLRLLQGAQAQAGRRPGI